MKVLLALSLMVLTGCVKLGLREPHRSISGPWVDCVLLRIDAKGMSGTAKCTNVHDGKFYIVIITVRPLENHPENPPQNIRLHLEP